MAAERRVAALEAIVDALADHATTVADATENTTGTATLAALEAATLAKHEARLAQARRDLAAHYTDLAAARQRHLAEDAVARSARIASGKPGRPPPATLPIPQALLGTRRVHVHASPSCRQAPSSPPPRRQDSH